MPYQQKVEKHQHLNLCNLGQLQLIEITGGVGYWGWETIRNGCEKDGPSSVIPVEVIVITLAIYVPDGVEGFFTPLILILKLPKVVWLLVTGITIWEPPITTPLLEEDIPEAVTGINETKLEYVKSKPDGNSI